MKINIEMVEAFKNLSKSIVNFIEEKLLKESEISCSEFSVLKAIEELDDKVNVTEIATFLKMSKSAVSQIIAKLEKKNLVKRKISLFDKKIHYIILTESAKEKIETSKIESEKIISEIVNEMGEKEITDLSRLLDRLSVVIDEIGKVEEIC